MRWLAVVWAMATGTIAQAEPTTLVYATPYTPNHTFSRADKTWMKWVEEQSHGALRIRPIWSGALLSSDQSMTELRHGVADIGLITPIYTRGGTHLLRIQTGFYIGAKTYEQQVAMYRCLAAASPEYAKELEGLKVLAVQGGTLPGLLTRTREVRSLNDLKGLRLRVPTELLNVLKDLGADPIAMPMGDVYSALAKGVLDGVIAPPDTLKSLHFGEVAKFFWQLEVPRGAYPGRAMGERRWEALTDAERTVLEASIPIWEAAIAKETRDAVQIGMAEGHAQGINFLPVSPEDQQRFNALYEQDAERSARALSRLGIDGEAVFMDAHRIGQGIERTGEVRCHGDADAAT
jgi:TRAP-type C4-dicarboxylate transport system substrate-binding protein